MRKLELVGQRFGRLTVIEEAEKKGTLSRWKCRCDCGTELIVIGTCLTSGHSQSCGCYKRDKSSEIHKTHGETKSRLYQIWAGIAARCNNPHKRCFHQYGGRGIKRCSEWDDYETFKKWAIEAGYNDELTIDRMDNNKGYSPENCRWVDRKTQSRNRRTAHLITYKGETKSLIEWSEKLGISRCTLKDRIGKLGWSIEEALSTPARHY